MHPWRRSFLKAFEKPRPSLVEITSDGFRFCRNKKIEVVEWRAVTQIDVCREDAFTTDMFSVILQVEPNITVCVSNLEEPLFPDFEKAVFVQWPEIEKSWKSVYCGPALVFEFVTLWKARQSY